MRRDHHHQRAKRLRPRNLPGPSDLSREALRGKTITQKRKTKMQTTNLRALRAAILSPRKGHQAKHCTGLKAPNRERTYARKESDPKVRRRRRLTGLCRGRRVASCSSPLRAWEATKAEIPEKWGKITKFPSPVRPPILGKKYRNITKIAFLE